MAFTKPVPTGQTYFKPELSIDYRPVDGLFRIYDFATKAVTEVKQLKFLSAINVYKYESSDDNFTSNIFENMFAQPLTLRFADTYRFLDTIRYDKNSKSFRNWNEDLQEFGSDTYKGATTLLAIGIYEGRVAQISIKGRVKLDLEKVNEDKANADNVKNFSDGVEILLTPSTEITKVGSGKKVKEIYLLQALSIPTFVPTPEDQARLEAISTEIRDEIARNNKAKPEPTTPRAEPISEEIHIGDIPFR